MSGNLPDEVWSPRQVEPLGRWRIGAGTTGGVDLKAYAILADAGQALGPELTEAARAVVEGAAGAVDATPHHDAGFVILHRGRQGIWLLLHWWQQGSICAQLLWRAEPGHHPDFRPLDRPPMACVWELALIDHERRAWTHTMMTVRPDRAAYLADLYPQGFC